MSDGKTNAAKAGAEKLEKAFFSGYKVMNQTRAWSEKNIEEEGHATDLITDEAIRVIQEQMDTSFFLYVAYSVPHTPIDEPESWTSLYDGIFFTHPSRKWYAASVSHMDEGIGRIIEALENTGQRNNTLVVFISDNGAGTRWHSETQYRGKYADKPHEIEGNNFPLRGFKGELYEGGIRVPAVINWPGQLDPGSLEMPVHIVDWLPTFCDLSAINLNMNELNLDGQSIWPLLTGEQAPSDHHPMYWKTKRSVAVRDGDWKLLVNNDADKMELFNLKDDFREMENVSEAHPEKVEQLKTLLDQFREGDR